MKLFSRGGRKGKDADMRGAGGSLHKNNPDADLVRGGSLNEEDPLVQKMGVIANQKYTRNKDLKLFVGDKIRLANKRKGKVTSLGPKQDRPGVYVRVVVDTAVGGSSSAVHSNSSSKPNSKAIWVPMHSVEKIIETAGRYNFTIGDRVFIEKKNIAGYVRYVGPTHFERGIWFGIELDEPKGKNNGTVKKKFYFSSKEDCGLFVHHKRLSMDPNDPRLLDSAQSNADPADALLRKGGYLNADGTMNHQQMNRVNDQIGASYGRYSGGNASGTSDEEDHKTAHAHQGSQSMSRSHSHQNNMHNNNYYDGSSGTGAGAGAAHNHNLSHSHTHTQSSGTDSVDSISIGSAPHASSAHGSHTHGNSASNSSLGPMDAFNDDDSEYGSPYQQSPHNENDNEFMQPSPGGDSPYNAEMGGSQFNTLLSASRGLVQNGGNEVPYGANPERFKFKQKTPFDGFLMLTDANPKQSLRHTSQELNERILAKFLKDKHVPAGLQKQLYESEFPTLIEAKKEEREDIFKKKLILCRAICEFSQETEPMQLMIKKKETMLLELSEFIARHHWFKEPLYHECLKTVSINLFRPLPYQYRPPSLSFFNDEVFDKDVNFEDPAWRHLKLVYDLTWRVINTPSVTADMMEKYMTSKFLESSGMDPNKNKQLKEGKFLESLVELFASEDHRERAYLMMILHKIYGRCLKLRPHIIKIICNYLYRMIYTNEFNHVNGIIELLQIICAIIPGLTVPVKDSWQEFLRTILVPLHKCRGLKKFWEQLTQCCVNYVAKDTDGGTVILGGLLKYWPKQSPQKEEIFIMEVVNIINVLITHQLTFQYEQYKDILVAAADKLTQCMLSTRQPVAERAIAAWKEQSMQRLVDYDRKAFLPKLCEAFYKNRNHQNQALRTSSTTVEKIYRSKDAAYWKKMQQYLQKKDKKEKQIERSIEEAELAGKDMIEFVNNNHKKHGKSNDPKKKKRKKHLTAKEIEAKRKAYWQKINEMAKLNEEKLNRKHRVGDSKSASKMSSSTPSPTNSINDEY